MSSLPSAIDMQPRILTAVVTLIVGVEQPGTNTGDRFWHIQVKLAAKGTQVPKRCRGSDTLTLPTPGSVVGRGGTPRTTVWARPLR